jgi:hypothetical protein
MMVSGRRGAARRGGLRGVRHLFLVLFGTFLPCVAAASVRPTHR